MRPTFPPLLLVDPTRLASSVWFSVVLGACTGIFTSNRSGEGGAEPDWSQTTACELSAQGSPLRRLTKTEYENTICDVLGFCEMQFDWLAELSNTAFDNDATLQTVLPDQVSQYLQSATTVAEEAAASTLALTGCDPAKGDEQACARAFVERYAAKLYRHPLSQEEDKALLARFAAGQQEEGFAGGMKEMVMALLMDPSFMFLVEQPSSDAKSGNAYRLADCEIASRLSYALWASAPDDELLTECGEQRLRSPEQIQSQAWRMLDDPRARRGMRRFFSYWLEVQELPNESTRQGIADFDAAAATALHEGLVLTASHLAFDAPSDRIDGILLGNAAFINRDSAPLWGYAASGFPSNGEFVRTALDPAQRLGVLSDPAWLAAHSSLTAVSYVHRGLFVRRRLLCQTFPAPTAEQQSTDVTVNENGQSVVDSTPTARQLSQLRVADSRCSGCHQAMEPSSWALPFDHGGRIDPEWGSTAASLTGVGDNEVQVSSAAELAQTLAQSSAFHACVSESELTYALGRPAVPQDHCTVEAVTKLGVEAGLGFKAWLVSLMSSYTMAHRPIIHEP